MKGIKSLAEIEESYIATGIKEAIEMAYTLIKGKACYRTFKIVEVSNNMIKVPESDRMFCGDNMVRLLYNCDYATLLVCTIGRDIVEKIEELEKTSLTEAFYLDRIGAWMADYMAEYTGGIIEKEIKKHGYEPTFRYAPGYGDWGLEAQREIMRLTEAEKIGVTITETCIMIPRFSVSAVIGWRRKE